MIVITMDYAYLGYTADRKIVKGKITAASESAATTTLSDLGYRVVDLKPVKSFLPNVRLFKSKVKANELVTFSRQLALLLESGVGIIHSLELQRDQTADAELKRVLNEIIPSLRSGSTLAEAMAKHPNVFSNIYSRMVEVGERTGSLDAVLKNLANYAENESRALAKLKNAPDCPGLRHYRGHSAGYLCFTAHREYVRVAWSRTAAYYQDTNIQCQFCKR